MAWAELQAMLCVLIEFHRYDCESHESSETIAASNIPTIQHVKYQVYSNSIQTTNMARKNRNGVLVTDMGKNGYFTHVYFERPEPSMSSR